MKRTADNIDDEFKPLVELIGDVLYEGLMNGAGKHDKFSWRNESLFEHLSKGIRHAMTYWIIKQGWQEDDKEPHLRLAVTRLIMAFDVEKYIKKNK